MPQLDPASYASQIFWLVITFVPLYFVLLKVALPRISSVLEARSGKIEEDLGRAEKLKQEAEAVLADYEKSLDEARSQAQAAVKATIDAMANKAAERGQAFGAELQKRIKSAEDEIAQAKRQAVANIKPVAAEVAGAATAKLIGVTPEAKQVAQAVEAALASPEARG